MLIAIELLVVALCAAVVGGALAAPASAKPGHGGLSVTKVELRRSCRRMGGTAIDRYTLRNARGMTVSILTYGGIIQELVVPDRRGRKANVTLGFDSIAGYTSAAYAGVEPVLRRDHRPLRQPHRRRAVHARRRRPTRSTPTTGRTRLHGGFKGFDKRVWAAEPFRTRARRSACG